MADEPSNERGASTHDVADAGHRTAARQEEASDLDSPITSSCVVHVHITNRLGKRSIRRLNTPFTHWNNEQMLNLNDLRIFEKVAVLRSFSAAARTLGAPKSSVSRSISRLEEEIGVRLFERTTRDVILTPSGEGLRDRCHQIMWRVHEALDFTASYGEVPRGLLRIGSGIGFGINVLSEHIPTFLLRYPNVKISLVLSSESADLVSEGIDVAIRMGPLPDSSLVAQRLGSMQRYLCAAPAYLATHGTPDTPDDIKAHEAIEMSAADGRARTWSFTRLDQSISVLLQPRITVNDALTIQRLAINAAGLAMISGYLCSPEIAAGRLVRLLPDWSSLPVDVSLVFPSKRELAPIVRAFVDHMRDVTIPDHLWLNDPMRGRSVASSLLG